MVTLKKFSTKIMFFVLAGLFAGAASAVSGTTVTWLSPDSDVGQRHIIMYESFGAGSCLGCHARPSDQADGGFQFPALTAPFLSFKGVDMHEGRACVSCHLDGLFISRMPEYERCSDCHEVSKRRTEGKNKN